MNRRTIRLALALAFAVLGAFWFEVDFSSSQQIAQPPAAQVRAAEPGAAAHYPWPSLTGLGRALTGGIATSLPPWGVLALALAYLTGRLSFKRRSIRR